MVGTMERWWVALVTFERGTRTQDVLPDEFQGACGWMACLTADDEAIRDQIETALTANGLKLREIDRLTLVESSDDVEEFDSHLGQNISILEPGKTVVWGTIHLYRADGEA